MGRLSLVLPIIVVSLLHAVLVESGDPSALKLLPLHRIADEIYEAEQNAQELQYQVGNSTQEKSSLQWFMATTMKELTKLTKTTMNTSLDGSLSYKAEACLNRTEAAHPKWDEKKGLKQAIEDDKTLAPQMLEAEMYLHFEAETRCEDLTKEIGHCKAKCPAAPSFLQVRTVAPKKAPSGSLVSTGQGEKPRRKSETPDPRTMMKSIAEAIYNTSETIDTMKDHLTKDEAAKDVLKSLSTTVMTKLLNAKKEIEDMTVRLEVCEQKPETTRLIDEAKEMLGVDPEITLEIVQKAEERTSGSKKQVAELEAKLDVCRRKCDLLYHYRDELKEGESAI